MHARAGPSLLVPDRPYRHCLIRPAAAGDLGAVAAIFGHYVTTSVATFEVTPPTVRHWRHVPGDLRDRGLPFLVCECDGQLAGYASTVESTIYLAPGHTGRGLGRRLLTVLQRQCALAGAEQMIAVIADSGDPASAALHRACGFTEAGLLRAVGSKHGRVIDTRLFQCDLREEPRVRSE